ncbi:MAG: hypothetical protein QME66_04520 [Candidatus Eisenbacteria bacterium]|nr:hypothetical protein [Candidatus Eisenbacteria bacterium]
MTEQEIVRKLRQGIPFQGLSDIQLVEARPDKAPTTVQDNRRRPDIVLTLNVGETQVTVYCEIRSQVTPKLLEQIAPWLTRIKAVRPEGTCALVCPFLSPASQKYCQLNGIDFIDLCGNVLLRIPGKIFIERVGRPNIYRERQTLRNPFRGASSRVLRVLLQSPKRVWTVTTIAKELEQESERQNRKKAFVLSVSSISKTIQTLEQELLVRRDEQRIVVPEPRQLLFRWVDKYKEQYKRIQQSGRTCRNPFGFNIESSVTGLLSRFKDMDIVVTGSAAAGTIAPVVNVDRIDVFVLRDMPDDILSALDRGQSVGPDFLFIYPYDAGVFMYSRNVDGLPVVSDIQTWLDCYARGGRDVNQASYLLSSVIEKRWNKP